jgi:hypothetical protein
MAIASKLLYVYPVICVLYQLSRGGKTQPRRKKAPSEVARSHPVLGYLVLDRRDVVPETYAWLFDREGSNRELLATLKHAQVIKVQGGMLLRGLEDAGHREHQRQAWWCLPGPLDDLTSASPSAQRAQST